MTWDCYGLAQKVACGRPAGTLAASCPGCPSYTEERQREQERLDENTGHSSAPQSTAIIGRTMLGRQRCESVVGEVEAEDDEAHSRTRAGQLQHEPEQCDDGELTPRYEMLSPSQSRWNAGWRNGAPKAAVRAISR